VSALWYLRTLAARLRGLFGNRRAERELDDEIETHLRLLTGRYVRRGMTQEVAAREARRQFGNVTLLKERSRDMRVIRFIETLLQDLRYGARMLWRNPGFTFVAMLMLALAIGANSAIFSVVNGVLFQSAPYRDSDRIMVIFDRTIVADLDYVGGVDFVHWREQSKAFEQIEAYDVRDANLVLNEESERLAEGVVSAGLFDVLGVEPALGRAFTPVEEKEDALPVVILSHGLWQRSFGGDPRVIGRSVKLDSQNRTIIGVMPPRFIFKREIDLWVPLTNPEQTGFMVIGRLKSGVTPEGARADLTAITQRMRQGPSSKYSKPKFSVIKLHEWLVGNLRLPLMVLLGAVTFVLLIACANVANLLLARAVVRQKELAIRTALGAGRFRLVRQLLTESLLLSLMGGLAGLLLATMGVKLLVAMSPAGIAPIKESGVDVYTVGFTCVVVFLTIILTGLLPALHASKTDVNEMLKAQPSAGSVRHNVRYALPALMVAEVALTLVLLVGAGLMIKSFLRLLAVPKGFNPAGVLTIELSPSAAKYPRSSHRRTYNQELLTRVQALPGVRSAGLSSFLPLTGTTRVMPLKVEGRAPFDSEKIVPADINIISPDYFQTMGIQLIAGRPFTAQDVDETQHVAIINQTIARRFFPNENPIGLRLAEFAKPKIIVGVVADTRHFGLDQEVHPEVYLPYLQDSNLAMSLVVRSSTDPKNSASLRSLATVVRNEARAMEPNQPVNQIVAMEKYLMDSVSSRQFRMFVLAIFAAVALIITIAGIYGVISYVVSQRTHEIGIRMSLGAQARDVLRMVVWRGMSLTLIGVALGLAAALALTRVMKNLLFEVSATDPATFALIASLLIGAALIASYIPARRATKVDPLQALRHD